MSDLLFADTLTKYDQTRGHKIAIAKGGTM